MTGNAQCGATMNTLENRLVELETRLAYQDDVVLALNDVVSRQQRQIDNLESVVRMLIERIRQLPVSSDTADATAPEIPPHY